MEESAKEASKDLAALLGMIMMVVGWANFFEAKTIPRWQGFFVWATIFIIGLMILQSSSKEKGR